jgi:SNF2 family DNA or RNA helicase
MDEYEMYVNGTGLPKGFVLNMLTALRHECGLIKVPSTIQYIKDYNEITGKPLVVFAHHQDVLKGIWMELSNDKDKKWRLAGISGDMPANKRQLAVEAFQDGKLDVILCSTMAAKEGITLTAADTVVFVEREWVPGWEEQAEDRVNRIGQDSNSVHAVYLSVADTIDERFNMVVEAKRQVVKAVLDGGDMEEREGIANMLIQSMIEAGDLPADFLQNMKKKGEKK